MAELSNSPMRNIRSVRALRSGQPNHLIFRGSGYTALRRSGWFSFRGPVVRPPTAFIATKQLNDLSADLTQLFRLPRGFLDAARAA